MLEQSASFLNVIAGLRKLGDVCWPVALTGITALQGALEEPRDAWDVRAMISKVLRLDINDDAGLDEAAVSQMDPGFREELLAAAEALNAKFGRMDPPAGSPRILSYDYLIDFAAIVLKRAYSP